MIGEEHGERILRDTQHVIELGVDIDGTETAPDAVGTCTVVDANGDAVASGATTTSVTKSQFTLDTTATGDVKRLVATWNLTFSGVAQEFVTRHEVVTELLVTEAGARAFDGGAISDTSDYPTANVLEARDETHDEFERIIGVALGGRYGREIVAGDGGQELQLESKRVNRLLGIAERAVGGQTWTAYSSSELADVLIEPGGLLVRETLGSFTSGRQNVRVEYEHGLMPIPLDLKRAALWVVRYKLVRSNIDQRALRIVDQTGTWELATPGKAGSWYGLPEADAVLNDYRRRLGGAVSVY